MGPDAVRLTLVRGGRGSSYEFTCPGCRDDVRKPADRRTVAILVSAGVDATTSEAPRFGAAEPADAESIGHVCDAPGFTIDDVIDFHFLLLDDRWIEECLAEIRSR